jgi:hypothetical protein
MRHLTSLLFILISAGLVFEVLPVGPAQSTETRREGRSAPDENLAIIVNTSNPLENLSMEELRRIFLGERGHWPSGRRITLVMMGPDQPERRVILRDVCQMNETEFNYHFLHGLFTGEVLVSPKTLATPLGARKFVFNVPGAIGYLRVSDVDTSVRVVRVDERLPDDKGYKLHIQQRPFR